MKPVARRFGLTSPERYMVKAYKVHYYPGAPEDIVKSLVYNQTANWLRGFGGFNVTWIQKVVPILTHHNVPKPAWGMYRAFTNEFMAKVVRKGVTDAETIIRKWVGLGLRPEVLRDIVEGIMLPRPEVARE